MNLVTTTKSGNNTPFHASLDSLILGLGDFSPQHSHLLAQHKGQEVYALVVCVIVSEALGPQSVEPIATF